MTHPGGFLSMFAQVIVGLGAKPGGAVRRPEAAAGGRFPYATQAPGKGLTLMHVVTVGFLTVINGHVR
jgi:hypothetical protein